MEKVSNVSVESVNDSKFVKLMRMHYVQDGIGKIWDISLVPDSVTVVIYNKTNKTLVLVKQLRAAVLFRESRKEFSISNLKENVSFINESLKDMDSDAAKRGITMELCAGCVDKHDKSLADIATEEVLEECGFKLSQPLEYVQTFHQAIGMCGDKKAMFYAEVSEEDRVSNGGGVAAEGEMIEVVELSLDEVKEYLKHPDVNTNAATLYGLQWFLLNKAGNAME